MPPPDPRSARAVLLVEDDPAVRRVAARVLQTAGYSVVQANDGLQAWAEFQRDPSGFSALLADVVMPRMPGTELAARVHAVRPSMPVLLMTAYTEADLLARGLVTTEDRLLAKPFRNEVLLEAIQKALRE
jgi:two-component system, cell cycle sensor histidine kinase and response regulator CckA